MMAIAAARLLRNDDVCFVGIGAPSLACNLARLTHAPDITLIYESGTVGARPDVLPLSIGDPELCETARTTVSVPEMFAYWLQGGISAGFLGGAVLTASPTSTRASSGRTIAGRCAPGGGGAGDRRALPSDLRRDGAN
jgi:glutaconate CoA-transferase subunit B